MMNNTELKKGEKGEQFFVHKLAFPFFFDEGAMENLKTGGKTFLTIETAKNIEGEYRLDDGCLVEVKSLYGPYNNILIELAEGNNDGWYQHCRNNGVDFLVLNRFRNDEDVYPVYSILLFFPALSDFIDRKLLDQCWVNSHKTKPKLQKSMSGKMKEYILLRIEWDELFYKAQCCLKIAYPVSIAKPHEANPDISMIIHRIAAPEAHESCYMRIDPILFPWDSTS